MVLPYSETGPELKQHFYRVYNQYYESQMARKLGLTNIKDHSYPMPAEEKTLLTEFFALLDKSGCDFTNTFRDLSQVNFMGDEELVNRIMSHKAPKEVLVKAVKEKFAVDPRVLHLF